MNITLLGHYDIACLFALDRLIRLQSQHRFTAFLSASPVPPAASTAPLATLAHADARLCEQFLGGELGGPVATELTEANVTLFENPNSTDGLQTLRASNPDLVVSIRYRRILRDAAIAVPRLGVLNLHSGILPDYRGVMATFWAMQNRETEIGTTLHWITDAGIDTGPVIGIRRRAADPSQSYLANVLGLYTDGCEMLSMAISAVAEGEPLAAEDQDAEGPYFGAPAEADAEKFEQAGLQLTNGSEVAQIRALRSP